MIVDVSLASVQRNLLGEFWNSERYMPRLSPHWRPRLPASRRV